MEIKGRIIAALEPRGGVSQKTGTAWKTQEFVLETQEQYPRKCCFEVFGEDKLNSMNIQVGEFCIVSIDIDARSWSDKDGKTRWSNSIRAWRVIHTDQNFQQISTAQTLPLGATASPQPQPAQSPQPDMYNPFAPPPFA